MSFNNHKQLVFLVYTARSGSTLLASSLESFSEVGVSIEDKIPWGLGFFDEYFKDPRSIKGSLISDQKFNYWDISEDSIDSILKGSTKKILPNILDSYFSKIKPRASIHVYKSPDYIYLIKDIFKKFPHSKVLHIYRDPRAVFSSQKKNLTSNKKNTFINNPYTFSKVWKKVMRADRKWRSDPRFFSIKYEELVLEHNDLLLEVGTFLSVTKTNLQEDSNYSQRIPGDQKHLHKLVGEKPELSRINGWAQEISQLEIYILQKQLSSEMQEYDYKKIATSSYSILEDMLIFIDYLYMRIKNLLKLLLSFSALTYRLRLLKRNLGK